MFQCRARHLFCKRTFDFLVDDAASNVEQPAILHTRRTRGLTGSASEASIQMNLGAARGLDAFEHLLHQINSAARSIELVAEQLIGGAGGRTKATVHAAAHDLLGFLAFGRVFDEIGELRSHGCDALLKDPGTAGRD